MMSVVPTLILSLILSAYTITSLQSSVTISNHGRIKTIGIKTDTENIVWGMIEPNSTASYIINVSPNGSMPVTLQFNTSNWNPENASDYIHLSWNYTGAIIEPDIWVPINLILAVDADIRGINVFSFDIIIWAVEA